MELCYNRTCLLEKKEYKRFGESFGKGQRGVDKGIKTLGKMEYTDNKTVCCNIYPIIELRIIRGFNQDCANECHINSIEAVN